MSIEIQVRKKPDRRHVDPATSRPGSAPRVHTLTVCGERTSDEASHPVANSGGDRKGYGVRLRARPDVVETWTDEEVTRRMMTVYRLVKSMGLLPIALDDYLELLDWSGRAVREGKRGAIPEHLAPILDRLGINQGLWTDLVTKFDTLFSHPVSRRAFAFPMNW